MKEVMIMEYREEGGEGSLLECKECGIFAMTTDGSTNQVLREHVAYHQEQEFNMVPRTFRKKPITIQAMQYTDDKSALDIVNWAGEDKVRLRRNTDGDIMGLVVETLEGEMYGSLHDWIIKGVQGEFYPCKPGIFENTYEEEE